MLWFFKKGCQNSKCQNWSTRNLSTKILGARILSTTEFWALEQIAEAEPFVNRNEGEEGHEMGEEEVDTVQILDIDQELSGDPIFLSLLHDLMHKTTTNIVVW